MCGVGMGVQNCVNGDGFVILRFNLSPVNALENFTANLKLMKLYFTTIAYH
jgi:hypothetical protein